MILASENGKPEIFYTLQGEGPSCGRPAIFLRLSNCNLTCKWCDTPYTWNFEKTKSDHPEKYSKKDQQIEVTTREVIRAINLYPNYAILVITGGEPMLQQLHIEDMLSNLGNNRVEIETNGTITPNEMLAQRCYFNVSLKLSNSGVDIEKRLKQKPIQTFIENKSIFKFVVDTQKDLDEIYGIVQHYKINHNTVWLMPQGKTKQELDSKLEWLSEACIDNGYNLTNRLHVQTWGNERGV